MVVSKRANMLLGAMTVLLCVAALVMLPSLSWAQEPESERPITLDLRDTPLEEALRALFIDTPYDFALEPGISGTVTVMVNNATFSQALRAILELHNLTYRKETDSLYIITRKPPPTPAGGVAPTVVAPTAKRQTYLIGRGGRYELQFLECRTVAAWFFGWNAGGSPIPVPVAQPNTATLGGGGGIGGGGGLSGGGGGGLSGGGGGGLSGGGGGGGPPGGGGGGGGGPGGGGGGGTGGGGGGTGGGGPGGFGGGG